MLCLVVVSFSNRFNHFLLNKGTWFLNKIRIVKDKDKFLEKWSEKVDDFHEGAEYLKKNKLLCLRTFIYNLCYLGLVYVMPFFVILALSHGQMENVTWVKSMVASAYVLIIGSFVPIPGASGGIEFGYFQFFGNFIKGSLLRASLLVWRSISYYLPMILGAVLFNINTKRDEEV